MDEQEQCSLLETNNAAVFKNTVTDNRLEMIQISEKQSSNLAREVENGPSTQEADGATSNDSAKYCPALALKDSCLQVGWEFLVFSFFPFILF